MQQTVLPRSVSRLIERAGLAVQPAIRVEVTPAETALSPYTSKFGGAPFLWQIDSDEDAGFEWIDDGTVYILVRREALRKGDLSAPWLDLQCF